MNSSILLMAENQPAEFLRLLAWAIKHNMLLEPDDAEACLIIAKKFEAEQNKESDDESAAQ